MLHCHARGALDSGFQSCSANEQNRLHGFFGKMAKRMNANQIGCTLKTVDIIDTFHQGRAVLVCSGKRDAITRILIGANNGEPISSVIVTSYDSCHKNGITLCEVRPSANRRTPTHLLLDHRILTQSITADRPRSSAFGSGLKECEGFEL
jgi:hypothetical protein